MPAGIAYTYWEVKALVEGTDRVLLTLQEDYSDSHHLRIQCRCGNQSQTTLRGVLKSHQCLKCLGQSRRTPYLVIKENFRENGCTLLSLESEYENAHSKMRYICVCGRESIIAINQFNKGRRCFDCGIEARSGILNHNFGVLGPDHPAFRPNKSFSRRNNLTTWRNSIIGRDKLCLKCGERLKLEAHHIYSWETCIELRFEISNGATLCHYHHKRFHSLYGLTNNNQAQFDNFLTLVGV
jgi:hypothetical protein